jgi:hypothetical protein
LALSGDVNYARRGPAANRNEFGYAPTSGVVIYRGALLGLTAAGTVQPLQASGSVAFAGLADRASNTAGQPVVQSYVIGLKGTWSLTVPGVTQANIGTYLNVPVYATDDNTLTLSSNSGANLQIGTVAGIDNGQTYVNIAGS